MKLDNDKQRWSKWTQQLRDQLAEHEVAAPDDLWADIEAALAQQPAEAPLCEVAPPVCEVAPHDCEVAPHDCEVAPHDCEVVSHPQTSRFVTLRRWAAAASVAALTLGGGYWWWNQYHEPRPSLTVQNSAQPLPSLAAQSEAQLLPSLQGEGCLRSAPWDACHSKKGGVGSVTSTLRRAKIQTPPLTPPLEGRGAAAQEISSAPRQLMPIATIPADSVPDGFPVGSAALPSSGSAAPSSAERSPLNSQGNSLRSHPRTKTSPSRLTSPLKASPTLGLYAMNGVNSQRSSNGVLMAEALVRKYDDIYANSYGPTTRSNEPIYLTGYEERQHHHRPIAYGLTLSYPLTKRLSLTSGVVYTKLFSDFTQVMRRQQVEQEQTLHYVGIPLGLSYQLWALKGFRAYVSAGAKADWNVATHLVTEGVTQELPKDRLQWSFSGSLGVQYDVVPLVGLYVEPGLSWYPDNGSRLQNYFKDKPWNMSLQVGLRINFGRNK